MLMYVLVACLARVIARDYCLQLQCDGQLNRARYMFRARVASKTDTFDTRIEGTKRNGVGEDVFVPQLCDAAIDGRAQT